MRSFVLATLAFTITLNAQAFEAGFGRCEITPDVTVYDVPMAGYGAREGKPANGVHDPLLAKVMILRAGESQFALISLDLRSVTPELKNAIVDRITAPGFTTTNVLVCASHNHSGPSFYPQKFWQLQFGQFDPKIIPPMASAIARAVDHAHANLQPAKIGFGQVRLEGMTKNRRWGYDTKAREAAGETPAVNPLLTVIRIDDEQNHARGLLVHFATHPTILGHTNMDLSGEWPGAMQRELERDFPGATVLYTNGAEGDQSPDGVTGDTPHERVTRYGQHLAREAKGIAHTLQNKGIKPAAVRAVLHQPDLPPLTFSEASKNGPYAFMEPMAHEALPKQAAIQVLRIGPIVMVGLPGEPICEVGLAAEAALRKAGAKSTLTIGLANDYIGYILNEKEYYGPGLGDFIAKQAGVAAQEAMK